MLLRGRQSDNILHSFCGTGGVFNVCDLPRTRAVSCLVGYHFDITSFGNISVRHLRNSARRGVPRR